MVYDIDPGSGDLRQVFDPNGNSLTFTRDGVISSTGKSVTFERDPQGRITAVVDPLGNRVRYQYDQQRRSGLGESTARAIRPHSSTTNRPIRIT